MDLSLSKDIKVCQNRKIDKPSKINQELDQNKYWCDNSIVHDKSSLVSLQTCITTNKLQRYLRALVTTWPYLLWLRHSMAISTQCENKLYLYLNRYSFGQLTRKSRVRIQQGFFFNFYDHEWRLIKSLFSYPKKCFSGTTDARISYL